MEDDQETEQNFDSKKGWSQYQILVLQSLRDHTTMLKEVMEKISMLEKQNAVLDILNKNWRDNYDKNLSVFNNDLISTRQDITDLEERLRPIEEKHLMEEKSTLRLKSIWAVIGSAAVIGINLIVEAVKYYLSKH